MTDVKLTEAEVRGPYVGQGIDHIVELLRERGLIAPEPAPVDEAVRAISEARGITGASNIVSMRADIYCDDLADAFERGMELAPARPLTREMVRKMLWKAFEESGAKDMDHYDFGSSPESCTNNALALSDVFYRLLSDRQP